MFNRLGQRYKKHMIVDATKDPNKIIEGILRFADEIKNENPDLYKALKQYQNESPIDWSSVDEKEMEIHLQNILNAVDVVAPEGTEFKQDQTGAWGFIPVDNVLDPDASEATDEFTYDLAGSSYMVQEKHVKHIMKEATKRILKTYSGKSE